MISVRVLAKETILNNNTNADIVFVQGDVTNPPFKKEAFDIAYSWGVMHHTPNTRNTFKTLSNLVKDKGIFGIYVYVFNPVYNYDQHILGLLAYLRSYFNKAIEIHLFTNAGYFS